MTGAAPGTYSVQVVSGPNTATLAAAFAVDPAATPTPAPGAAGPFSVVLTAPSRIRTGPRVTEVTVDYYNNTGNDVPAPLLTISATNAILEYRPGVPNNLEIDPAAPEGDPTITFLAVDTGSGLPGVLPPHFHGTMTIPVISQLTISGSQFIVYQSSVADPTQPLNLASLVPSLQPVGFPDAQWQPIFQRLASDLGPTQGGLIAALDRDANLLPASMGDPHSLIDLLQIDVARAEAELRRFDRRDRH